MRLRMSRAKAISLAFTTILICLTAPLSGCGNVETRQPTTQAIPGHQNGVWTNGPSSSPINPTPIVQTSVAPALVPSTSLSGAGSNIIIDHTNWDEYNNEAQTVFENVGEARIFFAHASVGTNILQGLADLNQAERLKYPLVQKSVNAVPPLDTVKGTIYEYSRGNPPWPEKINGFQSSINSGWNDDMADIAMNKFCYIDPAANWTAYCNSMTALEAQYPRVRFVYWTMPLTTFTDSNAVLRSQFNQNLRNWVATQKNKILFDVADIEAWDPDGQSQTFILKGETHYKLYSGYAADEGHLNAIGRIRVATGLYSLFGEIMTSKR
jgi:hypothetical protein